MVTPKYCTYCGKELIFKEKRKRYDNFTGEVIYTKYLECPNRFFLIFTLPCETYTYSKLAGWEKDEGW